MRKSTVIYCNCNHADLASDALLGRDFLKIASPRLGIRLLQPLLLECKSYQVKQQNFIVYQGR